MSSDNKDQDFAPINFDVNDRIPTGTGRRPAAPQTVVKSNNKLVIVLSIVSAIAIFSCVFLFLQLEDTKSALTQNQSRIQTLENRLSATGEEIGNSTVELQVKVTELSAKADELWEQMDKLWASAWRRNQQEIKALEQSTTGFQKDVNALVNKQKQRIDSNESTSQQLASRVQSLSTSITDQANSVTALNVQLEGLSEQDSRAAANLREAQEKIILLERRNTNLLQKLNELEALVNELTKKTV